jgi:hypothetical protein
MVNHSHHHDHPAFAPIAHVHEHRWEMELVGEFLNLD